MHGNKANNLQSVGKLGLPVPEFYVVDAESLSKICQKKAAAKLATITEAKLLKSFRYWCQQNDIKEVAVRSSAEAEDSKDQSFAGQFASVMKVSTDEQFIKALKEVFLSRPQNGYGKKTNHKVHAIVQRYVEPNAAGVLFTVNPANGLSEMLINASAGHGGKVVDGSEAQSFYVDRISGDIRTEKTANFGLLPQAQITELTSMGLMIEQHFGSPQDIEWAVAAGKIYILQSRPITNINYLKVWDNANIGESFPGIVMPLTFSIARRGYELVYKSQAFEGGMSWYQLEANHRIFHDMVGLFGGRMYYNLASWYQFIGLFPSNRRNQKFLDDQLQTVGDVVYLPPSSYPARQKIGFYARALRRTLLFEQEKQRYWDRLDDAFAKYQMLPQGQSLPLLLKRYVFVEQMIVPHMGRSADNDFFVMTYHGLLKRYLRKWLGDSQDSSANFLGALNDVISARQAELLTIIASKINNDQKASQYLARGNFKQLDNHLTTGAAAPFINEYRAKFLHRFAGDQKIESTNPLLSLDGFYSLIKTYCQLDSQAAELRRSQAIKADHDRRRQVMKQLNQLQKILYKVLLKRLKHHLRIREHNRLTRGKAYALLRELFPLVGKELTELGIIVAASDVYYLDIEEILRYVNGTGYGDDARQTVAARKLRYKSYKKTKVPSRFITTMLADKLPDAAAPPTDRSIIAAKSLPGALSSPGDARGKVIVLDEPILPKEPFEILVVSHTDPGWTPLIALAKGVIVEHGGVLSHAAIVTRELGIPSIIGVKDATQVLKNGMEVNINAAKSSVDIIKHKQEL